MMRWVAFGAMVALAGACASLDPGPPAPQRDPPTDHAEPPSVVSRPAPACPETPGAAWPGAAPGPAGLVRAVRGIRGEAGHLAQTLHDGRQLRLRFLGAHVFDLLDKVWHEGGSTEARRRRLICAVLNDAAARGVAVLRVWGTLKRTGSSEEIARAGQMLALVLDENARRSHPLRFIVPLLNHQAGYGAPDPSVSLDDQPAASPWHARALYLRSTWRQPGIGQLSERLASYRRIPAIAGSRYVLAWELVNELDTFRHLGGGSFAGSEATQLRDHFIVPALTELATRFPQPIAIGDLRGNLGGYERFATTTIAALPELVRARLLWTSHVYAERGKPPSQFMSKLGVDLAMTRRLGMPFLLGELGEHVPGAEARFCAQAPRHDVAALLAAVRGRGVEAAVFWGEGRCGLEVEAATGWRVNLGAGADSAEVGTDDDATHRLLGDTRRRWAGAR